MNYVLESIKKYSSHTFFQELVGTPEIPDWSPISYETYLRDLEKAAFFWHIQLANHNIQSNDVVGLWYALFKPKRLIMLITHQVNGLKVFRFGAPLWLIVGWRHPPGL